ncbi:MAG: BMC domain-containing protein [Ignavibacteriaceae bacterium]|nr:BMC domain-containing protein [Ignavibacteriaceae bacterium]
MIGILETKGFAAAMAAAEKILENKSIRLLKIEKIGGGLITLFFSGDTLELNSAFKDGIRYGRSVGEIVGLYIVNKNFEQVEEFLEINQYKSASRLLTNQTINQTSYKPAAKILDKESSTKNKKVPDSSATIQRLRKEAFANPKTTSQLEPDLDELEKKKSQEINLNKIELLNVQEMRRFARKVKGFPIQGREISRANRKELLNYFKDLK